MQHFNPNRFLACARIKVYWMAPEWGSAAKDLPPETQFLLLQLSPSGPYAIILPLIDTGKFRATLRPAAVRAACCSWVVDRVRSRSGETSWLVCLAIRKGKDRSKLMQVRVESGDASVTADRWDNVLLVAAGTDPYDLVDAAVSAAAEISGVFEKLSSL